MYPPSELSGSGMLPVSPLHDVAYWEYGNPAGQPVLCVHGGPGAGAYTKHSQFFDAKHWRIILVDQRGCGQSTPLGCLEDNTTDALLEDFEKVRQHLQIDTWVLFGGSWGTALSLAYAQRYTDRVDGLILRAMCLMRPQEIDWMYREGLAGVAALQPAAWNQFIGPLLPEERANPLAAWYARLASSDTSIRDHAAGAWMRYDMSVGKIPSKDLQSWTGAGWKKSAIGEGAPHTLPPLQRPYHPPQPGPPGSLDLPASTAAAAHGSGSTTQSNGPTSNGRASAARSGAHSRAQTHTPSRDRGAPAARAGTPEAQVPGLKGKRNPLWVSPDVQQPSQASIEAGSPTDSGTAPAADSAAAEEPQEAASKGISTWTAQALLTAHYCVNSAFLLDNPILENIDCLRGIPAIGIQGRMDLVCPPGTAFDVHMAWPELRLRLVGDAGHSQYDPAIQHELLQATDAMRSPSWPKPVRKSRAVASAVL